MKNSGRDLVLINQKYGNAQTTIAAAPIRIIGRRPILSDIFPDHSTTPTVSNALRSEMMSSEFRFNPSSVVP